MTAQSNISNTKNPLSILRYASALGYHTVLDAAASAPTSHISLTDYPVDAMAVSFYKMFGFPTGVGALLAKKSFLRQLQRPWFSGGNVDIVQVPGTIVTFSPELHERFEVRIYSFLCSVGGSTNAERDRMEPSTTFHSGLFPTDFDSYLPICRSFRCAYPA